jgi:hypothetical protein
MHHGGKFIADGQVRTFTGDILQGSITTSGTWSGAMIGQQGLNLLFLRAPPPLSMEQ